MGIGEPEIFKQFPHMKRIFELEEKIKNLKWYQFGLKSTYRSELEELRIFGWNLGMEIALRDLEKWGMIRKVSLDKIKSNN